MAENKDEIPTLGEMTAHEKANIDAFIDMLATMSEIDFEAVTGVYKRAIEDPKTPESTREVYNQTLGTIEVLAGARNRIEADNS